MHACTHKHHVQFGPYKLSKLKDFKLEFWGHTVMHTDLSAM